MNVYNEMPTLRQDIELRPLPQRSIPQLLSFAYLSTWGKSLNQSRKPCKHWTALQNSPNGSLGYFATVRHCCMTHCRWHWTSFSISRNLRGTPTVVLHSSQTTTKEGEFDTPEVREHCRKEHVNFDSMRFFIPFVTVTWFNDKGRLHLPVMNESPIREPHQNEWIATTVTWMV